MRRLAAAVVAGDVELEAAAAPLHGTIEMVAAMKAAGRKLRGRQR